MEPKFKKGDTVWFTSNWFAGSYIPDTFVVWDVRTEDGKNQYRKKRMRTWWDEDKLFATEKECQEHEVSRFIEDIHKDADQLIKSCDAEGVKQETLKILETGEYEPAKTPVYNHGDKVWGHTGKSVVEYDNPTEYTIADRFESSEKGKDFFFYTLKGHGTLTVFDDQIFPTRKEALLDNAFAFRRDKLGVINGLKERCVKLGIPCDKLISTEKELFGTND